MQSISPGHKHLNPGNIPTLKLKQLQYESETWKRLLDFLMDENINLKHRLSEILKNKFDKILMDELEDYQSNFIKEDEVIGLLRYEVAELDKLIENEITENNQLNLEIEKKINNLRNNISTVEKQFSNLKLDFNCYLSENM